MSRSLSLTVAFRIYCFRSSRSWWTPEAREALRRILWDRTMISSFLLAHTTTTV